LPARQLLTAPNASSLLEATAAALLLVEEEATVEENLIEEEIEAREAHEAIRDANTPATRNMSEQNNKSMFVKIGSDDHDII
jgi:hypothetical protein